MKTFLFILFLPCLLFSLEIPIDPDGNVSFTIPIPSHFQEIWRSPNGRMVEYIPENETLEAWNEIITVETIPRQVEMLDFYLRKHKLAMEMLFSTSELTHSESYSSEETGIKVGYAHYRSPHYLVESQTVDHFFLECMGMKVVQGKNNLYRVAYNIKYPQATSHLPIEEKIEQFLESCKLNSLHEKH